MADAKKKQVKMRKNGKREKRRAQTIEGTSENRYPAAYRVRTKSKTGKILGGCLQAATLKSFCFVLLVHALKIHPIEF